MDHFLLILLYIMYIRGVQTFFRKCIQLGGPHMVASETLNWIHLVQVYFGVEP